MSAKASVLVIEDDETIQELVESMLRLDGFSVTCANNGVEGLQEIKRFKPDLIILDIGMPVMDGETFIRTYHKMSVEHAPIVATSAYSVDPRTIEGLDGFLKKPFDLHGLRNVVNSALNKYASV
jgi:CheY-like chemotaxis protein